jgi:hypothetical protein
MRSTVRFQPILLKNSIALPGRTSHRKVDRSECATSDASGPGKGSTTPRNQSKASDEEFFNRIDPEQTLARRKKTLPSAGVLSRNLIASPTRLIP